MSKRHSSDTILEAISIFIICLLCISILLPFWFIFVDSISYASASAQLGIKLWPSKISFNAYYEVFQKKIILTAYFNTIYRVFFVVILGLFVTICGAYPLSKKRMPFRTFFTRLMLFTMFFSGGLIPSFILIRNLGLIDNRWALIIPNLAVAYYIFIMRNFFYSFPDSLEESALIDGANEIQILIKIILPLSMPIIAVVALWFTVGQWNEWFQAMIYNRNPKLLVLQLLIRKIYLEQQASELFSDTSLGENNVTSESVKAATLFVTVGPIILVYPFVQKYFVKGIMVGAVKG